MWGQNLELLLPSLSNLDAPSQEHRQGKGDMFPGAAQPLPNDKGFSNMGED